MEYTEIPEIVLAAVSTVWRGGAEMESSDWMGLVIAIAWWIWDLLQKAWKAMTWRDVLLLLLFLGMWAALRELGRIASQLGKLCEQIEALEERNRLVLQRHDEKLDKIQRGLGAQSRPTT